MRFSLLKSAFAALAAGAVIHSDHSELRRGDDNCYRAVLRGGIRDQSGSDSISNGLALCAAQYGLSVVTVGAVTNFVSATIIVPKTTITTATVTSSTIVVTLSSTALSSFTTETQTSVVTTAISVVFSTTTSLTPVRKRDQVDIQLPAYASPCSGLARYSSACSLLAVKSPTITIGTVTISVTQTTQSAVTSTTSTTLIDKSTSTSIISMITTIPTTTIVQISTTTTTTSIATTTAACNSFWIRDKFTQRFLATPLAQSVKLVALGVSTISARGVFAYDAVNRQILDSQGRPFSGPTSGTQFGPQFLTLNSDPQRAALTCTIDASDPTVEKFQCYMSARPIYFGLMTSGVNTTVLYCSTNTFPHYGIYASDWEVVDACA